jgi:hypothetical protein
MSNFKKILIACLLCIAPQVFAMSQCVMVQPIDPHEGIWNVITRIAAAVDELALNGVPLPIYCDLVISQTVVGNGNTFVITGSNLTYCMNQTITFNTGAAITISGQSSSITIDMNGNILDGGNNATQGIVIGHGAQNIIIQNGIIQNIGGSGGNGYAIADDTGSPLINNVIIRDMSFNNNAQGAIIFGLGAQPAVDNLLIENCTAYNSGGISASSLGTIVRGCILDETRGLGFGSDIVLSATHVNNLARFATILDCIVSSSFGVNSTAQIITNFAQNTSILNSISQGSRINGFRFSQFQNVALNGCVAQSAGDSGFTFTSPLAVGASSSNVVLIDCVAQQSGARVGVGQGFQVVQDTDGGYLSLKFLGCVAQQSAQNGFLLDHNPGSMASSGILFQNCTSSANGANGFLVKRNVGNGTWNDLVFDDCVSQQNNGHGFAIENQGSDQTIANIVFRNCTAQANAGGSFGGSTFNGDGFGIGSSTLNTGPISDVIFQMCFSQTNSSDGFDFGPTTSNIQIIDSNALKNTAFGIKSTGTNVLFFGNTSINNIAGDYVGVADLTQIVSYAFPGALNGAGKWVNVKS